VRIVAHLHSESRRSQFFPALAVRLRELASLQLV
jgi:hypothetical protein